MVSYQIQARNNNLFKSIKIESKDSSQVILSYGFFGGASYHLKHNVGIITEYNTNTINTGVFYKHDFFMIQLNSFAFKALSLTFHLNLAFNNA